MMRFSGKVMRAAVRTPMAKWQPTRFLSNTVTEELKDEQQFYDSMDKIAAPAGWQEHYKSGDGYFRMSSKTGETEVLVDVEFKGHEEERLEFTAYLTKNGITADFSLTFTEGKGLVLDGMTTYDKKSTATDLTAEAENERSNRYEGPDVSDLENTDIPNKVLEVLDTVGVNDSLAEFLMNHCTLLEQTSYMHFLGDLEKLA